MTVTKENTSNVYAIMSLTDSSLFKGQSADKEWVPFFDDRLRTFGQQEISETDLGEDEIFVEIVDRSPDFNTPKSDDPNHDLLHRDIERFAPLLNELFYEDDEYSRLVGIHIDRHDFYYRLRKEAGDHFLSMACKIIPIRDRVDPKYYEVMERRSGGEPCPALIITREQDKPWPRPTAPAAYRHCFGETENLIFGPFTDHEEFSCFKKQVEELAGIGDAARWDDEFYNHPSFVGKIITEDMLATASDFNEEDDLFDMLLALKTM